MVSLTFHIIKKNIWTSIGMAVFKRNRKFKRKALFHLIVFLIIHSSQTFCHHWAKVLKFPSSSCRTICTDIPDPFSPSLPIVHRFRPVLRYTLLTNPSARAGYDTRSIFKRSLTGLNSEFSFSYSSRLIKAEEPSLPYYLPIAGGKIIGFIAFPRVLVLCQMQPGSSRI